MVRSQHESGVEGLRGFAALCVLYTHLLWPGDIDPAYSWTVNWQILEVSQGAVLLFFILSGYVIGLTNKAPLSIANWRDYLRRRGIRLIPLCWLAIVLSVLARPGAPLGRVIANLLFLQNDIPYGDVALPVLRENTNLWTLNYEALYYAIFVVLWWRPERVRTWLVLALAGSVGAWMLPGNWGPLLSSYSLGWVFWLAGYAVSQTGPAIRGQTPAQLPWPSLLLFWIVVWQQKPLWQLLHRIDWLPRESGAWANYAFVDFLPACLALLLAASGRRPRGTWLLCYAVAGLPVAYELWTVLRGRAGWPLDHQAWMLIAGCLLWWWRPDGIAAWSRLAWVGSISYGLYVLQRPMQWMIHDTHWLPVGTAGSFLLRLALAISCTFVLAWWAEQRIQPWLRRRFSPAHRLALAPKATTTVAPIG